MKATVKGGRIVNLEGGGEVGKVWMRDFEKGRDASAEGRKTTFGVSPAPGINWLEEIMYGVHPRAFRLGYKYRYQGSETVSYTHLDVYKRQVLTYFLTSPGDPTMPQRALSAKDAKTARFSFTTTGIIAIFFGVSILIIGGAIHVLMPGVEAKDSVLPLFIATYYPPVIKGICLAGTVAAVMSSFDSFLILATTHIMYDIEMCIRDRTGPCDC